MTILELHNEVRKLVPRGCSTNVELCVWTFSSQPDETEVTVRAYADYAGRRDAAIANTPEAALELFKLVVLPAIGLANETPPLERLAAMEDA